MTRWLPDISRMTRRTDSRASANAAGPCRMRRRRVYWTKRTVTIQAGEQVVTDGKTLVRGRCGNNISVAPLLPTLDNEPKPDVFDSIVAPLAPNTLVKLDPAHSYFTPQDLKTPQGPGGRAPFGNSVGGFAGPPPAGNGGTPGTFSNPPSGDPTPNGVPPEATSRRTT